MIFGRSSNKRKLVLLSGLVLISLLIGLVVHHHNTTYMPITENEYLAYTERDNEGVEQILPFDNGFAVTGHDYYKYFEYNEDYVLGERFLLKDDFYRLKKPKKEYYELLIFDRKSKATSPKIVDLFDLLGEKELKREEPKIITTQLYKDARNNKSYISIVVQYIKKKDRTTTSNGYWYDLDTQQLTDSPKIKDEDIRRAWDSYSSDYDIKYEMENYYWDIILSRAHLLGAEGFSISDKNGNIIIDQQVIGQLTIAEQYPQLMDSDTNLRVFLDLDKTWTVEESRQVLNLFKRKEQANFMDGLVVNPQEILTMDNHEHLLQSFEDYERYVYDPREVSIDVFLKREDVKAILQSKGSRLLPIGINVLDNSVFTIDLANRSSIYTIDDFDEGRLDDLLKRIQEARVGNHYYGEIERNLSVLKQYTDAIDSSKDTTQYDSQLLYFDYSYNDLLSIADKTGNLDRLMKLIEEGKKAKIVSILRVESSTFESGEVELTDDVYDSGYFVGSNDVEFDKKEPYRVTDSTGIHLNIEDNLFVFIKNGKATPVKLPKVSSLNNN